MFNNNTTATCPQVW